MFASGWNGVFLYWPVLKQTLMVTVVSDASRTCGCRGYLGTHWFQLQWLLAIQQASIQLKKFIPLIIAIVLFEHQWASQIVQFQVDYQAMVDVVFLYLQ